MLAPRWSAWVVMTLASEPLRYVELKDRLPWLADGQLHPRLRKLTDAGLLKRTELSTRHVTYGLTGRGKQLLPVLTVISTWGDAHLEDEVHDENTGRHRATRVPPARNAEDTIALISPRHATALLWALKARGATTAKALAAEAMPGHGLQAVYKPLERLTTDGLVTTISCSFMLTGSGQSLAPVYQALSAWASGRSLGEAGFHPVWGRQPTPSHTRSGFWATTPQRPAASTATATRTASRPATAWRPTELFSHGIPARAVTPVGSQRR